MHTGDEAIATLARGQHGIVTSAQLAAAGLGPRAIAHRVAHGRLVRLHRGVFQVGPSRRSAVRRWRRSWRPAASSATTRPPTSGASAPTTARSISPSPAPAPRPRPGLAIHRSHSLNAAVHRGLPLTTPTRTLHDLAAHLPQHELDRAVEQAQILHLATRDEIEVDLLWRRERLIVEVDGFAYHSTRQAFERDRARDAALQAAGYRVVRFTWRQIIHEPHAVVAQLARLIA